MIPKPDSDPGQRPPFTGGFAILLALLGPYLQLTIHLLMLWLEGVSEPTATSLAYVGIAAILGYGAAFALAVPRIPPPPGAALGFLPAPRICWAAALALAPSILLISEVDNLLRSIWPLEETAIPPPEEAPGGLRLIELAIVFIAVLPVVEEVFFRGLLQPRLVKAWGASRGLLLSAGLAGLAAFLSSANPRVLPVALSAGLVLGILRESAGSVLPGLALNMGFGALRVLAVLGAFGIPGFDDTEAAHTPLLWLAPAALATGLGIGLCRAAWLAQRKLERAGTPPPTGDRPD